MKIPKKVRITSKVVYKVQIVTAFEKEPYTMGTCCPDDKLILLRADLSPRNLLVTFIHELIHAMQFEHGIKIRHSSINQLDSAIERLLRLNRWI